MSETTAASDTTAQATADTTTQVAATTPVVAAATTTDPDFSQVPKDLLPYIEKARAQEKQKLYKEKEALKAKIAELEGKTAAPTTTPTQATTDDTPKIKDLFLELKNEIRALEQRQEEKARQAELRQFRAEQIQRVRAEGSNLVESLVSGDTPEAIEASLEVARAEYQVLAAEWERKYKAANPPQTTRSVTVAPAGPPSGVPPTVGSASTTDHTPAMTLARLKELTSEESRRDGTYAKHRNEILAALRNGRIVSSGV